MKNILKFLKKKCLLDPCRHTVEKIPKKNKPKKEKLVFLHPPKTGGTAILKMLAPNYEGKTFIASQEWINNEYTEKLKQMKDFDFIAGHMKIFNINQMPFDDKFTFIFLRDPIERIKSLYKFIQAHSWDALIEENNCLYRQFKGMSFLEFLKSAKNNVNCTDNIYVRMLSNVPYDRAQIFSEEVDYALDSLDKFSFIGLQEHLDKDIKALAKKKKLKISSIIKDNVSITNFKDYPERYVDISNVKMDLKNSEVIDILKKSTKYDYLIYNKAKKLREKIISQIK